MDRNLIISCAAGVALGALGASIMASKKKAPLPKKTKGNRYLIFGKNGWIGGMLIELLTEAGEEVCVCLCCGGCSPRFPTDI